MVVALFPMTLHLFGSYSYDALTIGLSFLMTALVAKLFWEEERDRRSIFVQFLVVLFLLAPSKVVYACIGFVALFAPVFAFLPHVSSALCLKCWLLSLWPFRFLLLSLGSFTVECCFGELDSRGDEVGVFWSLSDIPSNPLRVFSYCGALLKSTVLCGFNIQGIVLGGSKSIQVFLVLCPCDVGGLCISCVRDKDDSIMPSASFRIVGAIAVGVASFGVVLSMWLGWTFVTETVIQGVQGALFLTFDAPLLQGNPFKVLEVR